MNRFSLWGRTSTSWHGLKNARVFFFDNRGRAQRVFFQGPVYFWAMGRGARAAGRGHWPRVKALIFKALRWQCAAQGRVK